MEDENDRNQKLQESGLIEWSVFSELVAMDEDEEGFSKSLFQTFVEQVGETFQEINTNLQTKNLEKLSSLGHYLKGSAAALGLVSISEQCERIQNYGHRNNFDSFKIELSQLPKEKADLDPKLHFDSATKLPAVSAPVTESELNDSSNDTFWIKLIEDALNKARVDFVKARAALNEYYDDEI